MPNTDLDRLLGNERPIKTVVVNGTPVSFWNPIDSSESLYAQLLDINVEITELQSKFSEEAIKKQAELNSRSQITTEDGEETAKPKGKAKKSEDETATALKVLETNKEYEKLRRDLRKRRTQFPGLYRRYLEVVARQHEGSLSHLRPSQIYALYDDISPIVSRILDNPDEFDPEGDPIGEEGNDQAIAPTPQTGENGRSQITEMTSTVTSIG